MITKKSKRTRKLKKEKVKWTPNPFVFRAPTDPYSNGVLGENELIGPGDMSVDEEATATRVVSLDYNQILSARDTARKKAREEHDKWLKAHGVK